MTTQFPLLRSVPDELPTARVAPCMEPRLVQTRDDGSPLGLVGEQQLGHLQVAPSTDSTSGLIDVLTRARLQGRGGAGFPAHVKWRSVAAADGDRVVVANGHEGEPASGKDRWLLLNRPHLVLEGLLLAGRALRAARTIVCVSREDTRASVEAAIADLVDAALVPEGVSIEVVVLDHRYVTGEESALVQGINGKVALPTFKPPRPFEEGVGGQPTLIQNVETLAHVAWIHHHGPAAFGELGTHTSPGSALFTIMGGPEGCAVIEAPLGIEIHELLSFVGVQPEDVSRLLLGGWFGGVHASEVLGLECDYTTLRVAGTGLGCASLTVIGPDEDVAAIVGQLGAWYASESAQQCGVCRNGTRAIGKVLAKNAAGLADEDDLADLSRWGVTLPGRGACGFLDGAATLARTTVSVISAKEFVSAKAVRAGAPTPSQEQS
ncbi:MULTISPECIES: NADH-ubiquinone oxidoreductase-F iron-sulfur binding region domain-containing protein [Janibacter]|uniref:NADH-ubiquinone oxidoreductase-F iron-sulfur binding region domain-containing protein n=1 Tax=Janibacter TaxID=53457 RepID=UPI00082F78FC|nr:NADH-ubiquinone oxidoreductase-F iron-sulfur binding region domain-containing protein [Janibacter terrae]